MEVLPLALPLPWQTRAWLGLGAVALSVGGIPVADPPAAAAAGPLAVLVAGGVLARHAIRLEVAGEHVVVVQRRVRRTSRLELRRATAVLVSGSGRVGRDAVVVLSAERDGQGVTIELVRERSARFAVQPAQVLDVLAAALERSVRARSHEAATLLRAQSAHLAAGGDPAGSPLVALVPPPPPPGSGWRALLDLPPWP